MFIRPLIFILLLFLFSFVIHEFLILDNLTLVDLTETEDIKKRWQEYTEELYKKGLNDPDNHGGVVTHWNQTS